VFGQDSVTGTTGKGRERVVENGRGMKRDYGREDGTGLEIREEKERKVYMYCVVLKIL